MQFLLWVTKALDLTFCVRRHEALMTTSAKLGLMGRLAAIPYTGAATDVLDEMGRPNQSLPPTIQSLMPGQTLVGCPLTLRGEPMTSGDTDVIYVPFLRMLGDIKLGSAFVYEVNDEPFLYCAAMNRSRFLS